MESNEAVRVEARTEDSSTASRPTHPTPKTLRALRSDGGTHAGFLDELTAYQQDVLLLLGRDGPCAAVDLRERLARLYSDEDSPPPMPDTGMYRNLDILVDAGLVDKTDTGRANEYALSKRGRRFVFDRSEDWMDAADAVGMRSEAWGDES